jgi:hypothetical protein
LPIIAGTGYFNWSGSAWNKAGVNEIIVYNRTGPYFYQRELHNYISGSILCPTCDFRTSNGIMSISYDEKVALFQSDMELQLGNNCKSGSKSVQCQFVYMAKLY